MKADSRFVDISRTRGNFDSSDVKDDKVYLLKKSFGEIEEGKIRVVLLKRGDIWVLQKRYYFTVGEGVVCGGFWRYMGSDTVYKGKIFNKWFFDKILENTIEYLPEYQFKTRCDEETRKEFENNNIPCLVSNKLSSI